MRAGTEQIGYRPLVHEDGRLLVLWDGSQVFSGEAPQGPVWWRPFECVSPLSRFSKLSEAVEGDACNASLLEGKEMS